MKSHSVNLQKCYVEYFDTDMDDKLGVDFTFMLHSL